jgi:hypothetical protein
MKVYIVDLEAVETRYTAQWKAFLPKQLRDRNLDVEAVYGDEITRSTSPGAFLNFSGTNAYKSSQLIKIANLFSSNKIKPGDYFLYTDAWNPTVIQLKYMSELLNIPIKIGGLWHAGSYDPQDFLGRLIGDKPWVRSAEHSMFSCYDHNFFATKSHVEMFANCFGDWTADELIENNESVKVVGWPMEYLHDTLLPYDRDVKKSKIVFPHRLAPEKQLEIFKDLAKEMPEYEWVVAQETRLTKDEYHHLLADSRMVFSANLQETLGISMYEGALLGSFPLVPDRLSYSEMWDNYFKYPSEWTKDWNSYQENKSLLVNKIRNIMGSNNQDLSNIVKNKTLGTTDKFFNGRRLYDIIVDSKT